MLINFILKHEKIYSKYTVCVLWSERLSAIFYYRIWVFIDNMGCCLFSTVFAGLN